MTWAPDTTARIFVRAMTTMVPGLLVTECVDAEGGYVVTHQATGLCLLPKHVDQFPTVDAALDFARRLAALDWEPEDVHDDAHREAILAALRGESWLRGDS